MSGRSTPPRSADVLSGTARWTPALDPGRARGAVVSDVAACEEIPTRLDPGCAIRPIPRSSGVPSLETRSSHRRPHGVEAREKEESDGHGIVPHIVRVG